MLQFNKSEATNKNAVYLDSVNTGSGYYDSLVAVYSQSFDNSNGIFDVIATSVPNIYRHWLILENSGSDVPSPSGQYDVSIYTKEIVPAIWGTHSTLWANDSDLWSEAGDDLPVQLIYSDRAFISGSNDSSITQYLSPDENGTYVTYNG